MASAMESEKLNLKLKLKLYMHELLSLRASPSSIIWGFTIGTLVALSPTWGIQTLIIAALVSIFKKNFTSAYISSWIFGNPFVALPAYALEYKIGAMIIGSQPAHLPGRFDLADLAGLGWHTLIPVVVGYLILALPLAILVHLGFGAWFKNRRRKLETA